MCCILNLVYVSILTIFGGVESLRRGSRSVLSHLQSDSGVDRDAEPQTFAI